MKKPNSTFVTLLILFVLNNNLSAQEVTQEYQIRSSASVSFTPVKKLKLTFTPEVRFNESFEVSRYLLEGKLRYKPIKHLYLSGYYRFIINPRNEKPTEYMHRVSLGVSYKRKFNDFEPGIKLSYTNDSDDDNGDGSNDHFLRYKLWLGYNIPKCKLTPEIGADLFQQLGESGLYKVRYKVGFDYKIAKDNYIELSYKLDYYIKEFTNKHIFGIGYILKL